MQSVVPRRSPERKPEKETAAAGNGRGKPEDQLKNTESAKVSTEEFEYLESIFTNPFLTVTGRAEKLGLSSYMNNKMKKTLIERGFINEFSANLGYSTRGNVKFLELTKSGYMAISKRMPLGKQHTCSSEHWLYQIASHAWYSQKGYHCEIEMNLNGKRADLGIQKDGKTIALEFELTPKNACQNATKGLKAGFQKIILICKNHKVKTAVEKKLQQVLVDQQWKKVKVMLLNDFAFIKEILGKTKQ